jgi:hypothetical protein
MKKQKLFAQQNEEAAHLILAETLRLFPIPPNCRKLVHRWRHRARVMWDGSERVYEYPEGTLFDEVQGDCKE